MAPPDGQDAGKATGGMPGATDALAAKVEELRRAAAQWGDTNGPEAQIISAMIGAIAELAVVGQRMELSQEHAGIRIRGAIGSWAAQATKVHEEVLTVMGQGRMVTGNMDQALKRFEAATATELPGKVVGMIAPNLVQALSKPLRDGIRVRNHRETLRQWLLAGGAALGVFVAGLITGLVMQSKSLTEMQVDYCQEHPIMGQDGNGYCALDRLRPAWVPIPPPGQIRPPLSGQ